MHGRLTTGLTTLTALLCGVLMLGLSGCTIQRWMNRQPCVLDPGATREEIVEYLNRNIIGTASRPGLVSWRSGSTRLRVDGVPVSLPASIAVEAPRNLRLLVSNPYTGGQEVDIGSNSERFWIWTKETRQVMTSRHEDVALALQELQMPVHIHPDWLMEVFGVIPLNPREYKLIRPKAENGEVELVAARQSPLGEDVERVIRVDLCRGRITEHFLQLPGGKILARARLDEYSTLPNGTELPLRVTLEWPDARMQMVMDIRHPEINVPGLASNSTIWQMPRNSQVVDIGAIARASSRRSTVEPVRHNVAIPRIPMENELEGPVEPNSPQPLKFDFTPDLGPPPADDDDTPEWARAQTVRRVSAEFADEQR